MDIVKEGDNTDSILRSINENNSKRLSKLLGRKVALNLAPADLSTSLLEAVRQGKGECVAALLQNGADPNCCDSEGRTPLLYLMETGGNPAILRELLKAGASPNKASWNSQQTALHIASRKGYQVAVKVLLSSGARPDKVDMAGCTPLMYAAREGHQTALRMLLREGANPGHSNGQRETPLHLSARGGLVECAAELIQAGADPNSKDMRGQTPLLLALKGAHTEIVDLLLDCHCDVNSQDTQTGKTILHIAVQNYDTSMVQKILRKGAAPNTRDHNWETPFMMALTRGRQDLLKLLMHHKCDVTATDKNFNTALHIAAREGLSELVPTLTEAGLDGNLKGHGGVTPLMLAAGGGHADIVAYLLRYGANPDLVDRHRAGALVYAVLSSALEDHVHRIVKMLIRSGCNVDERVMLGNVVRGLGVNLGSAVQLEDRMYSPLELAFIKTRPVVFLMLVHASCSVSEFSRERIYRTVDSSAASKMDFRTTLYLFKTVTTEKKEMKTLKELCRRPTLRGLASFPSQRRKMRYLPDSLKYFLNCPELDDLERQFQSRHSNNTPTTPASPAKDKQRQVSEIPRLASINENTAFSREEKARQTFTYGTIKRTPKSVTPGKRVRTPSSPSSVSSEESVTPSAGFSRGSTGRRSLKEPKSTPSSPKHAVPAPSWILNHSNRGSPESGTPRSGRSTPVSPMSPGGSRVTSPSHNNHTPGWTIPNKDIDHGSVRNSSLYGTMPRSRPTTPIGHLQNHTKGPRPSPARTHVDKQPVHNSQPAHHNLSNGTSPLPPPRRNRVSRTNSVSSRDTGFDSDNPASPNSTTSNSPYPNSPTSLNNTFNGHLLPAPHGGVAEPLHANKRNSVCDSVMSDTASECSHSSQESKTSTATTPSKSRIPVLARATSPSVRQGDESPGFFTRSRSFRKW